MEKMSFSVGIFVVVCSIILVPWVSGEYSGSDIFMPTDVYTPSAYFDTPMYQASSYFEEMKYTPSAYFDTPVYTPSVSFDFAGFLP